MRISVGFLTGFVLLGLAAPVWAASVEIPAATVENRLDLSMQYSRLFDRDLDADSAATDEISAGNQLDFRAGWMFQPWFVPYLKAGIATFDEQMENISIAGLGRRNVTLEYDVAGVWGGGASGIRSLGDGWSVGYDAQWLHSHHDLDSVTHAGNLGTFISGGAAIDQWHIAAYVEKEFLIWREYRLAPFIGGRFSGFDLEIDKDIAYTVPEGGVVLTGETSAADPLGLFLGLRWTEPSRWSASVEGRFLDELAVTARVRYTF